jgi:hypothetical protein
MKKFKLMDEVNYTYTFFVSESDTKYSLYLDGNEEVLIEAKDTGDGFVFTTRLPKEMDYAQISYLHLFLKLVNKFDKTLCETYTLYEEIAEI